MVLALVVGLAVASFWSGWTTLVIAVMVLISFLSDVHALGTRTQIKISKALGEHTCDYSEKDKEISRLSSEVDRKNATIRAMENSRVSLDKHLETVQQQALTAIKKNAKLEIVVEKQQEEIVRLTNVDAEDSSGTARIG